MSIIKTIQHQAIYFSNLIFAFIFINRFGILENQYILYRFWKSILMKFTRMKFTPYTLKIEIKKIEYEYYLNIVSLGLQK